MKISKKYLFILFFILIITVFSWNLYLFTHQGRSNIKEGFVSISQRIKQMQGTTNTSSGTQQIQGTQQMQGTQQIQGTTIKEEINNVKNVFTDLDNRLKSIPGIFDKMTIDFTRLPKVEINDVKNVFTDLDNRSKSIQGIFDKMTTDFTRLPKVKINR